MSIGKTQDVIGVSQGAEAALHTCAVFMSAWLAYLFPPAVAVFSVVVGLVVSQHTLRAKYEASNVEKLRTHVHTSPRRSVDGGPVLKAQLAGAYIQAPPTSLSSPSAPLSTVKPCESVGVKTPPVQPVASSTSANPLPTITKQKSSTLKHVNTLPSLSRSSCTKLRRNASAESAQSKADMVVSTGDKSLRPRARSVEYKLSREQLALVTLRSVSATPHFAC
eukprot:comp24349_c1_seq1/m.46557 comp24349_c1_seq1/g.46557  ORF comp24349_c1_seq1/g.46557 comp24349_c1_seq1/m.46557 type:complete len:221 (-) comp24349_c1_seq1:423-1085(-)